MVFERRLKGKYQFFAETVSWWLAVTTAKSGAPRNEEKADVEAGPFMFLT
jgi:hypothetical protein